MRMKGAGHNENSRMMKKTLSGPCGMLYIIQAMICYTWSGPGGMWCCFFHTRRILSGWTWSPFLELIYHENLSNLFDFHF